MSTQIDAFATAPDLIEAVVGFRQWRLGPGGLLSLHCAEPWPSATLEARCLHGRHPDRAAPVQSCCCGIYAWYQQTPRLASAGTADLVCGAVVMWGQIELHATGMRAQHARIVALALPFGRNKRRALVEVADRLGVLALPHAAVARAADREGAPVPDFLKPRSVRAL
jgi:hypothetical protein